MTKISHADSAAPTQESREGAKINRKLIDNVEVALEAYLGKARLTVADLNALAEGAVVPLEAQLNQAVELRLNGVPVGTGELVAVGDKFGVRLVELAR